jgi:DNA invertase Pin-like site-specific DNA recombinase
MVNHIPVHLGIPIVFRLLAEEHGITVIAKETKLSRQTAYRIQEDPAGVEAALTAWGL